MAYRAAPEEPLVLVGSLGMIALAPGTGALLWQLAFADHGIQTHGYTRVARLGELIVFSNGSQVAFVDAREGKVRARHELTFRVNQLVTRPPVTVAAGLAGVACFHDVHLSWRAEEVQLPNPSGGWFSGTTTAYDVFDASGRRLQRLDFWPGSRSLSDMALLLGEVVAQADHNT
jgi:hypothetical protein